MALNFFNTESVYSQDENLRKEELNELIEWVNEQKHLPRINEAQAILFLQRGNYQLEISKNLVDLYFTVKTLCPEIFLDRNPSNRPMFDYLDMQVVTPLSKKTPEGYTLFFAKLTSNSNDFDVVLAMKYWDMVHMLTLYQEQPSKGYIFILDIKEFTLEILAKMDIVALKKFFFYIQKCMPLNWKSLHFFNNTSIANRLLTMIKPFLDEFQDIIYLHNSVDDLIKYIPKDCLPNNDGGLEENASLLLDKMNAKLLENVALFDWEDEQKVDETKRPGGPKTVNDVFGVEETFKNLELD